MVRTAAAASAADRLRAVQRLDLALLVHAQHQRLVRRVQVQADHVAQLLDELLVAAELEGLGQVGLEAVLRARCAARWPRSRPAPPPSCACSSASPPAGWCAASPRPRPGSWPPRSGACGPAAAHPSPGRPGAKPGTGRARVGRSGARRPAGGRSLGWGRRRPPAGQSGPAPPRGRVRCGSAPRSPGWSLRPPKARWEAHVGSCSYNRPSQMICKSISDALH